MKRIFVCSPLKADTEEGVTKNIARAHELCRLVTLWGAAPFASHGFYTLFLDDFDPEHRKLGTECGHAWLTVSDEVWVWSKRGITTGMKAEIDVALSAKIAVVYDPLVWAGVTA